MRLIIRDTPSDASLYVANYIANRINAFNPTPKRPFVLGLPTGSSPMGVYKILVQKYKAGEISFKNVITFNMDEYVNLSASHPQSYHTFMYTHFFSHIDIPPTNVNLPNGTAPSLPQECARYETAIHEAGGIDLFLAGMGEDGHIAFNEPGSSLGSRTRVKTLMEETRVVNGRFFSEEDVDGAPKMAITVGVQTVMDAREVVMIVLGSKKASALKDCVEGSVSAMCTASALQMHQRARVVCDENASGELKVKTFKYFKSIEILAHEAGLEDQELQDFQTAQPVANPSKVRRGEVSIPTLPTKLPPTPPQTSVVLQEPASPTSSVSEIVQPQPVAPSHANTKFLVTTARSGGGVPIRSLTPEPIFDRMASRVDEPVFDRMGERIDEPGFAGRLTPQPLAVGV